MKECDTTKLALYIASTLEGAILSAKASGNVQDYLDVVDILSSYILSFKRLKMNMKKLKGYGRKVLTFYPTGLKMRSFSQL